ncbi:MAG: integration host factor subunit beta [Bacteroidetes bacterium]|nr:integration host factor subunit beta [Bacteroidota bacterium]
MRKADIISRISTETGIPKVDVLVTLETFFHTVKDTLSRGESVHVRGFGSFIIKTKAKKFGRDIRRNTTIVIPARKVPAFKPSKSFVSLVIDKLADSNNTTAVEETREDSGNNKPVLEQ